MDPTQPLEELQPSNSIPLSPDQLSQQQPSLQPQDILTANTLQPSQTLLKKPWDLNNNPQTKAVTMPNPTVGSYTKNQQNPIQESDKSYVTVWLFSLLLGFLGVDRFYLGRIGTGLLKLFTFGGFGVWYLIDLILVLTGSTKDKNKMPLRGRDKHLKLSVIITIALYVLQIILDIVLISSGTVTKNLNNYFNSANQSNSNSSYTTVPIQDQTAIINFGDEISIASSDMTNSPSNTQTDCQNMQLYLNQIKTIKIPSGKVGQDFSLSLNLMQRVVGDCSSVVTSNFSVASIARYNMDLTSLETSLTTLSTS
jgi:hypothetical protein